MMETDAMGHGAPPASAADHTEPALAEIRERLTVIQHETGELRTRAQARADHAEERLRQALEQLDQVRQELTEAQTRATAREGERDVYRSRYHRAIRERDAAQTQAQELAATTSYRLGHGVVMLLKHPIRTLSGPVRRRWPRRSGHGGRATSDASASTSAQQRTADSSGSGPPGRSSGSRKRSGQKPVLSDTLPVVAYIALGFTDDALAALARTVRQAALVGADHVPLIVTDTRRFTVVRPVAVEYVPDQETWTTHQGGHDWQELRRRRLSHLLAVHAPARTFFLDPGAPPTLTELLTLTSER